MSDAMTTHTPAEGVELKPVMPMDNLMASAEAILHLDAKGALAPHGIGGHARTIIEAFIQHELARRTPEPTAVSEWQPIATAPKDGKDILVAASTSLVRIAFWDAARGGVWSCWPGREDLTATVTHWQPLPSGPAALEPSNV